MKILLLSDSHASMRYMRQKIEEEMPDAVMHLGDYFSDGETMAEEYPDLPFFAVPGNCDLHRGWITEPSIKIVTLGGVRIMMTHGHLHRVKMERYSLIKDARENRVQIVCFGHTHEPYCNQEEDGLWVMNPGSAGYGGGSAGIIEVKDGKIVSCRLIR